MDNPERLTTLSTQKTQAETKNGQSRDNDNIEHTDNQRGNQEWTIQRDGQHGAQTKHRKGTQFLSLTKRMIL